jgi:fumarylacetoacetase
MAGDPTNTSWVESANRAHNGFPLQHLPLCVFRDPRSAQPHRIGVGIGNAILDLPAALDAGLLAPLDAPLREALRQPVLNNLLALGLDASAALRAALTGLLASGSAHAADGAALLVAQAQADYALPVAVGDYTDFLTSYHHALNVGTLFRPDAPVLPNFASLPIAYHGRASSVEVSGAPVYRPLGQFRASHHSPDIVFGPSRRLDFEMELGAYIGPGNQRGRAIPLAQADGHLAGLCLLNDWSARDLQAWESQPLGPFLGKNFLTTVSPWVVSPHALAPYRTAPSPRRATDPAVLGYLAHGGDASLATFAIQTEVHLRTAQMRAQGLDAHLIARADFARDTSWTFAQMVAHHTINGCNLRPGDLLGSGTISGPTPGTEGSLLEMTQGGQRPLRLPTGETRQFLDDGDEVVLSAFCERPGLPRLSFGECRGTVLPADSAVA